MLTHEQIAARFETDADTTETLFEIQRAGFDHGEAGYYPDGDYSSDADWCYGVGERIQQAETDLDIDDGAVFDLYTDAHAEGYAVRKRLPKFTSVGSYTILYTRSGECYCGDCARPTDHAATYDEGEMLECAECGADIESSYGPVEPEPAPLTFRVRLDVSGITGVAWEAWCDGPTDALKADGIEPCGLASGHLETWVVSGVDSEEAAAAIARRHLIDGVTIHDVTER